MSLPNGYESASLHLEGLERALASSSTKQRRAALCGLKRTLLDPGSSTVRALEALLTKLQMLI